MKVNTVVTVYINNKFIVIFGIQNSKKGSHAETSRTTFITTTPVPNFEPLLEAQTVQNRDHTVRAVKEEKKSKC